MSGDAAECTNLDLLLGLRATADRSVARLRRTVRWRSRPTYVPQDSAHWGALWGTGGHSMYRLTRDLQKVPGERNALACMTAQGVGGSDPSRSTGKSSGAYEALARYSSMAPAGIWAIPSSIT